MQGFRLTICTTSKVTVPGCYMVYLHFALAFPIAISACVNSFASTKGILGQGEGCSVFEASLNKYIKDLLNSR
jgi:hypothetical protein